MKKSNTSKRIKYRNLKWFVLLYGAALIAAILLYLISEAFAHTVINVFK